MKITIKFTLVLTFWLGFAAVGLVFISSLAPETKFEHFLKKEKDHALWFEERGLSTDFESSADILLNHSNWEFRYQALKLMKQKYPGRSADIFLNLAENDPDEFMRDRASVALASMGDKRAIAPLKKLIAEVDSLDHKMDLALSLSKVGDFSGLKYLLEAKDSPVNSDRYLSSLNMAILFKSREKIIEKHGVDLWVDLLKAYLQFGKDSYAPVRRNFVSYWPRDGVPEGLQEKFVELAKLIAESDPNEQVRFFAKMRVPRQ